MVCFFSACIMTSAIRREAVGFSSGDGGGGTRMSEARVARKQTLVFLHIFYPYATINLFSSYQIAWKQLAKILLWLERA